jgi:hypothetical protein
LEFDEQAVVQHRRGELRSPDIALPASCDRNTRLFDGKRGDSCRNSRSYNRFFGQIIEKTPFLNVNILFLRNKIAFNR